MLVASPAELPQSADLPAIPHRPFLFLRHGETPFNQEGRIQGHTDVPLSEIGVAQALQAADQLREEVANGLKIHKIITSPLQRAHVTAGMVQRVLGVPMELDVDLKEGGFGAFEGQLRLDILNAHGLQPTDSWAKVMPHDAEPWQSLQARAVQAALRHLQACAPDDGVVLFVGHGAWLTALVQHLGLPTGLRWPNAQPLRLNPAWYLTNLAGQTFSG